MRKKKKEEIPVTLSNQELIPSVIGVIDDKEKSNLPFLIIFFLLIGFIIALPTITAYLSGEQEINVNPNNTGGNTEKPEEPAGNELNFYTFSDDVSVSVSGISFQDFELSEGKIAFSITNNSEAKNYLAQHLLYLELYDSDKMLLQRIKLPTDNLSKGVTENYTFELSVSKSNITQFTLGEKTIEDYPTVNLKKENDGTYSLTCTKEEEKLVYEFDKDQKLNMITDVVNYSTSNSLYQEKLVDYRQMTSKYNAIDGVTSNLVEAGQGFTVTTIIDLQKVDFSNRSVKNTLNNKAYYGKDTEGKVVYFELSAMNYKCSM